MDELCRYGARELAHVIRSGDVTSREVIEAHLARIEEVNPSINAITITLADEAIAAADRADTASAAERARPLHGVPFTVKENIDYAGTPTTNGIPALAEAYVDVDSPIVARMKAAGAIGIGRTNLPELGSRIDTDNPLRGRTFNPFDPTLTPGGSSGGEGAAIATGMSPLGLGNDIGGSVRNPAYCCGIAAIKPTVGRVPWVTVNDPDGGIALEFLTDGPMARSVADLRVALGIIGGRHPDDPKSVDVPLDGPIPESLTAALVTEIPGIDLPDVTVREIERTGDILRNQGFEVRHAAPPELETVFDVWGKTLTFDGIGDREALAAIASDGLINLMAAMHEHFHKTPVTLDELLTERRRLRRIWSEFFATNNLVIGPTWTRLPFPCDADIDPDTGTGTMIDTLRFIAPGNVLGIPGLAVPTGVEAGLPTGVQIYADLFRDDLCLLAGECIERAVETPTPIDPRGSR